MGILAALAIPRFSGFSDKAKSQQALVEAKNIGSAIDVLEAEGKVYLKTDTPSATQYNWAMVKDLAGGADIPGTAEITAGTGGARTTFVYTSIVTNKDGNVFTASRDGNGNYTIGTVTTTP